MYRAMLSWEKATLALDIMQSHGLLTAGTPGAPLDGWWAAEYGWAGHELSGAGGMVRRCPLPPLVVTWYVTLSPSMLRSRPCKRSNSERRLPVRA